MEQDPIVTQKSYIPMSNVILRIMQIPLSNDNLEGDPTLTQKSYIPMSNGILRIMQIPLSNDNLEGDATLTQKSYIPMIWSAIASVGWYVLGVLVVLFFASPHIAEKYSKWKNKKDEKDYEAKYKKNPDLQEERLRAIEKARQRMQTKYNDTVEEAEHKKEVEKEEKMRELLKFSDEAGGHRLGNGSSASTSKYNDYNPLMGDSSRGYKPPKRSKCGGGGCGGS